MPYWYTITTYHIADAITTRHRRHKTRLPRAYTTPWLTHTADTINRRFASLPYFIALLPTDMPLIDDLASYPTCAYPYSSSHCYTHIVSPLITEILRSFSQLQIDIVLHKHTHSLATLVPEHVYATRIYSLAMQALIYATPWRAKENPRHMGRACRGLKREKMHTYTCAQTQIVARFWLVSTFIQTKKKAPWRWGLGGAYFVSTSAWEPPFARYLTAFMPYAT